MKATLSFLSLLAICIACFGASSAYAQNTSEDEADSALVASHPQDPWQSFNRKMFDFNDALDRAVLRPVARAYRDNAPQPVQTGISNFFGNLRDLWSGVNSALQAKPAHAAENVGRFLINSTVGIYGLFDVATHLGVERHSEDFGQTLGRWGVPSGPYLVLPLLGPSSVRDSISLVPDSRANLVNQIDDRSDRNVLWFSNLLNRRAQLLPLTDQVDRLAMDKYTLTRDAYLQKRLYDVYDGDPPQVNDKPDSEDESASIEDSAELPKNSP
jgi:phospholipid-binding lipoprotein MlaA